MYWVELISHWECVVTLLLLLLLVSDGWLTLLAVQRDKRAVPVPTTRSSEDIAIDSCRRDTRLRHWLTLAAAAAAASAVTQLAVRCWLSSTFICRRWELREIERHYRQLDRRRLSALATTQRCNNSEIELKSSSVACRGVPTFQPQSRTVSRTPPQPPCIPDTCHNLRLFLKFFLQQNINNLHLVIALSFHRQMTRSRMAVTFAISCHSNCYTHTEIIIKQWNRVLYTNKFDLI